MALRETGTSQALLFSPFGPFLRLEKYFFNYCLPFSSVQLNSSYFETITFAETISFLKYGSCKYLFFPLTTQLIGQCRVVTASNNFCSQAKALNLKISDSTSIFSLEIEHFELFQHFKLCEYFEHALSTTLARRHKRKILSSAIFISKVQQS